MPVFSDEGIPAVEGLVQVILHLCKFTSREEFSLVAPCGPRAAHGRPRGDRRNHSSYKMRDVTR